MAGLRSATPRLHAVCLLVLVVALSAPSQTMADGSYVLDSHGRCHDGSGAYAKQSLCSAATHATLRPKAAPVTRPRHCRRHKAAKCG